MSTSNEASPQINAVCAIRRPVAVRRDPNPRTIAAMAVAQIPEPVSSKLTGKT